MNNNTGVYMLNPGVVFTLFFKGRCGIHSCASYAR
jgi:hypothetical protein